MVQAEEAECGSKEGQMDCKETRRANSSKLKPWKHRIVKRERGGMDNGVCYLALECQT